MKRIIIVLFLLAGITGFLSAGENWFPLMFDEDTAEVGYSGTNGVSTNIAINGSGLTNLNAGAIANWANAIVDGILNMNGYGITNAGNVSVVSFLAEGAGSGSYQGLPSLLHLKTSSSATWIQSFSSDAWGSGAYVKGWYLEDDGDLVMGTYGATTTDPQVTYKTDGSMEVRHNATSGTQVVNYQTMRDAMRTNFVILKSWADVVANSSNGVPATYALKPNTYYEVNGTIAMTTNTISITNAGVRISGLNKSQDKFIYTGTNSAFTVSNQSFGIRWLTFQSPNGTFLTAQGTDTQTLALRDLNCPSTAKAWADISGFQKVYIEGSSFAGLATNSTGICVCANSAGRFARISRNDFDCDNSTNATILSFGTSVWDSIVMQGNSFHFNTNGGIAINSDSTNQNLSATGQGVLVANEFADNDLFSDATNYISGLSHKDIQWYWSGNAGAGDSTVIATMWTTNDITSTITATETPVLVTGSWVFGTEQAERLVPYVDGGVTNGLQYKGLNRVRVFAGASASCAPSSGNNIKMALYFYINGVAVEKTETTSTPDSGTPQRMVIMSNLQLNYNDYIQLYVENYDTTANAVFEKNIQVQINE